MADTKAFDKEFLTEQLKDFLDGEETTCVVFAEKFGYARGMPDSELHDQYRAVFQDIAFEGHFYQAIFHKMNSYYMSQVGEDCKPFEYTKGDEVVCERVYPITTVTYTTEKPKKPKKGKE